MKFGKKEILLASGIAIAAILFFFRGTAALKSFLLFVIASVPFYILLRSLDFDFGESLIYSFFLALGSYAYSVSYLGLFIGVWQSALIIWGILLIVSFVLHKRKKKTG